MSKPQTRRKYLSKPPQVVAIDISPLKVLDMTPEQVKVSMGAAAGGLRGKCKEVTGISDFNPFDLIESTDTIGDQRDSRQTRLSRSCLLSPAEKSEHQFRREVDKFLNGYSITGVDYLSDGVVDYPKQSDRYSRFIGINEENPEVGRYVKEAWSEMPSPFAVLNNQTENNQLRKSKSYDNQTFKGEKAPSSGPQYNVKSGGKVKTPAKGASHYQHQQNINKAILRRSNSLFKFDYVYAKTPQRTKDWKTTLHHLKKDGVLQDMMKPRLAKVYLTDTDRTVSQHSFHQFGAKKAQVKAKGAITTGHQTSEGTQSSAPQSPSHCNTKYTQYAQTAYNFEMQNHHKGVHSKRSVITTGMIMSPNDTQLCCMQESGLPAIQIDYDLDNWKSSQTKQGATSKGSMIQMSRPKSKISSALGVHTVISTPGKKATFHPTQKQSSGIKHSAFPSILNHPSSKLHSKNKLQNDIEKFKNQMANMQQLKQNQAKKGSLVQLNGKVTLDKRLQLLK